MNIIDLIEALYRVNKLNIRDVNINYIKGRKTNIWIGTGIFKNIT